jgi:hypothetical protein
MNILLASQFEMIEHLKNMESTFEKNLEIYCKQNCFDNKNIPLHLTNLYTSILLQKQFMNLET